MHDLVAELPSVVLLEILQAFCKFTSPRTGLLDLWRALGPEIFEDSAPPVSGCPCPWSKSSASPYWSGFIFFPLCRRVGCHSCSGSAARFHSSSMGCSLQSSYSLPPSSSAMHGNDHGCGSGACSSSKIFSRSEACLSCSGQHFSNRLPRTNQTEEPAVKCPCSSRFCSVAKIRAGPTKRPRVLFPGLVSSSSDLFPPDVHQITCRKISTLSCVENVWPAWAGLLRSIPKILFLHWVGAPPFCGALLSDCHMSVLETVPSVGWKSCLFHQATFPKHVAWVNILWWFHGSWGLGHILRELLQEWFQGVHEILFQACFLWTEPPAHTLPVSNAPHWVLSPGRCGVDRRIH